MPESYSRPAHTKRTVLRFAWLPVQCDTDDPHPQYVWLERYVSHEEWSSGGYGWSWVVVARYVRTPFSEPAHQHTTREDWNKLLRDMWQGDRLT